MGDQGDYGGLWRLEGTMVDYGGLQGTMRDYRDYGGLRGLWWTMGTIGDYGGLWGLGGTMVEYGGLQGTRGDYGDYGGLWRLWGTTGTIGDHGGLQVLWGTMGDYEGLWGDLEQDASVRSSGTIPGPAHQISLRDGFQESQTFKLKWLCWWGCPGSPLPPFIPSSLPHPSPLWDPGVRSPGLPSPLQCPELWVLWDPGHMQGPGVHQTPEPDYRGTPWGGWGGADSWREDSSCPTWPTPGVWHSLWAQVQTTVTLGEGSGSESSQAQLHPVGQRSRA